MRPPAKARRKDARHPGREWTAGLKDLRQVKLPWRPWQSSRGSSATSLTTLTRIVAEYEEESWHFKVGNPACQISVRDERR